jgi:replication-associated recombination protein RarA
LYPHDAPEGWVPQEHLPAEVAGERFYVPGPHGAEPRLAAAHEARKHRTDDAAAEAPDEHE